MLQTLVNNTDMPPQPNQPPASILSSVLRHPKDHNSEWWIPRQTGHSGPTNPKSTDANASKRHNPTRSSERNDGHRIVEVELAKHKYKAGQVKLEDGMGLGCSA